MKKMICLKDYQNCFFNLAGEVCHAKEGDFISITGNDLTFTYAINQRTGLKFYMPNVVVDRFFEEVK